VDLLKLAMNVFQSKLGAQGKDLDIGALQSGLLSLLGDGSNINIAELVSKFSGGDLAALATSWLGDGANQALSVDSLTSVLGSDKLQAFASAINVSSASANQALADTIPALIDQSSSGGNLLDSVGGAGGILGAAKGLFS